MNLNNHYDLAVIGAGPAGMAAAIEASRNNMKVLVLDDQPEEVITSLLPAFQSHERRGQVRVA